jgi:hypothetical protein
LIPVEAKVVLRPRGGIVRCASEARRLVLHAVQVEIDDRLEAKVFQRLGEALRIIFWFCSTAAFL